MQDKKPVTIDEMIAAVNLEILRLGYRQSALSRHGKQLREFSEYCEEHDIQYYEVGTGLQYFYNRYGIVMTDHNVKLNQQQLDTRCTVWLLDDVYHLGCSRRFSYHNYNVPIQYAALLEEYLAYCMRNNDAAGTVRIKRAKLRKFLGFLDARGIPVESMTPSDISEFMTTLTGYSRSTIHVYASILSRFFQYLEEIGIIKTELHSSIPRLKIYTEETIPETWTPEEVRKLLSAVDRTNPIGKRDYAMILLAVLLGMRVGDICALRFKDIDWKRRIISYTQQKTGKANTLPLLPEIGEAIIAYIKNGRLESPTDNVFVRHLPPYGALTTGSALSLSIKRYMRYAGLEMKPRKAAHALRHTLASNLLCDGIPLMTISNILGHFNTHTTSGYTKVDISALRKCALSYGRKEVAEYECTAIIG